MADAWTKERVETLTELWKAGQTAAQIARVLGAEITRSAVLGKIHRMKLAGAPRSSRQPKKRHQVVRPAGQQPVGLSRRDRVKAIQANASLPDLPVSEIATIVDADIVPVPLTSLEKGDCKWPIGDPRVAGFGFCGRTAIEDKPYCPAHQARAHAKVVFE